MTKRTRHSAVVRSPSVSSHQQVVGPYPEPERVAGFQGLAAPPVSAGGVRARVAVESEGVEASEEVAWRSCQRLRDTEQRQGRRRGGVHAGQNRHCRPGHHQTGEFAHRNLLSSAACGVPLRVPPPSCYDAVTSGDRAKNLLPSGGPRIRRRRRSDPRPSDGSGQAFGAADQPGYSTSRLRLRSSSAPPPQRRQSERPWP
jgi:hypothetical protein